MPSMLHSKASLGGIPSPGTSDRRHSFVWAIKNYSITITVSVFDFVQIAHARQTSSKFGLYSLKRDFQFFASDDDDSDDSGGIYFSNGGVVSYLFIMIK